ncbi:MAG: hypothetical protein Q9212_004396 [Teloschistes hypoglaucus]
MVDLVEKYKGYAVSVARSTCLRQWTCFFSFASQCRPRVLEDVSGGDLQFKGQIAMFATPWDNSEEQSKMEAQTPLHRRLSVTDGAIRSTKKSGNLRCRSRSIEAKFFCMHTTMYINWSLRH